MVIDSKIEAIKASLPSPKGVALQIIRLTQQDEVSNQDIAHAIKADPALSGRIIKLANARVAYQTRPIASIVDAVSVLGFNTVRQTVLGLSLMDDNRGGKCAAFDYQNFWARSLLTAITAQNLVLHSGIGSSEEVFILGLLGHIGSLALATVYPQEYARLLGISANDETTELGCLERGEFGFDHNQLTQAMLADWGMPQVFQDVVLFHEDPSLSGIEEDTRNGRLLNVLHIADCFSSMCLDQGVSRRKMVPKLILMTTRFGVEMEALTRLGDQSAHEWREWCLLCGIHSVHIPPFAELLEAVPLLGTMLGMTDDPSDNVTAFYPLRILLVDDDRVILVLLKSMLEKSGHTVLTASKGEEALGLIDEFVPQLIITDWLMPGMDGIEFCRALRKNPASRNIYVFIMTAQDGLEQLVIAFEAGANDYMTKPIRPKMLLARLRAAQRVVQLQEEMEFDRLQLHKFADELAASNQRMRKSDVAMRAILDNSPYMTWLKDVEGRYIRVNKTCFEYFRQKGILHILGKTDFDLWPKEQAEKHRLLDIEVMSSRQQRRSEESISEVGEIHWIEIFRTPVIDESGKVLGSTGFARDVTERKQIETKLRIAATAFDSQEGMMVTDANKVILQVNHAFTEITGYSSAEAVGQTPSMLKSDRHDAPFYTVMWQNIRRTGAWRGEVWNRRKNGEIYPEQLTITAVKGDANEITHYVATLHDITLRKATEEQIHTLAFYDALTQLPNRRLLNDRLSQTVAMSKRTGLYGALMFIDLDNFKPLNDTYGHGVGDLLLIEVARRLEKCVRETDTVARFGGDEFVVLLSELNGCNEDATVQASLVAEKIRISLSEPYLLTIKHDGQVTGNVEHSCTSSIGVLVFIDGASQQEILKMADIAMYQAKDAGRNTIRFYSKAL
jgi:diguanylate cyclase (GGDEF)-like protein/PAS domain S-box-containing protein